MTRSLRIVVALLAVQTLLVGVYWLVEQPRRSDSHLSTAPGQRVDGRLPRLSLQTRSGRPFELQTITRPTLVHFWATWCPPCRSELPGLLAVPEVYPIDVVAVALDEEWDDVERFLRDHDLSNIFLAGTPDLGDTMDVRTLPVTYLVEPGGNLRWRFDGARDWTNARFVRALGRFVSGPG